MARVTYSQRLDLGAIRTLLTSPQGGVVQDLMRRGLLVETQAKRNLAGVDGPKRIDTGRLRSSINTQVVSRNGDPAVLVGTNVHYAMFVHEGTGLYGPRHQVIRPKNRRFMRFRPRGSRRWVYARQTRGMPGNPFLRNALPAARG
jgi:hypothetical protein